MLILLNKLHFAQFVTFKEHRVHHQRYYVLPANAVPNLRRSRGRYNPAELKIIAHIVLNLEFRTVEKCPYPNMTYDQILEITDFLEKVRI